MGHSSRVWEQLPGLWGRGRELCALRVALVWVGLPGPQVRVGDTGVQDPEVIFTAGPLLTLISFPVCASYSGRTLPAPRLASIHTSQLRPQLPAN